MSETINRAAAARAIVVDVAQKSHRPLHIWPGDAGNIALTDLPEVGDEFMQQNPPDKIVDIVNGSGYEKDQIQVGKSYGVIQKQWIRGTGLVLQIGIWG